ncbi:MAG: hypothetical protein H7196_04640 [candidate division SR1 bacterium]|nr:hypothetical protein [candidate division SR1 bacterium]
MSKSTVITLAQILLNVEAESIKTANQKLIANLKKTKEVKPPDPQLKKNDRLNYSQIKPTQAKYQITDSWPIF